MISKQARTKAKHGEFVFVFFNTPYGDYTGFSHSIGTARIAWNLRRNGHSAHQYLPPGFQTVDDVARDILALKPKFVGFTCFDVHFPLVANIAQHIKNHANQVTIVVGGPTAVFSDEVILENFPQIDICVRGEGEEAAVALASGADLESIAGISYLRDGRVIRTADRKMMSEDEMDCYPSVYSPGLIPLDQSQKVGIMTSTGCIYSCTYCHFSVLSGRRIRFFAEDHVLEDVERIGRFWKAKGQRALIPILDEAFTINKKRTIHLCDEIVRMQLPLSFSCGTRGDCIDNEVLDALSAAGVVALFFGLESGAPKVLRQVRKTSSLGPPDDPYRPEIEFLESVRTSVAMAKKHGMAVSVSAIFGLPGETEEDAQQTLDLVKEMGVDYMHNVLQVYRGTQLWNEKEKFGITTTPFNDRWLIPHNTITRLDVTKVNILTDQDRVFCNMQRNEMHAVYVAFAGKKALGGSGPMPVFMRATKPNELKRHLLENKYQLGSRLILCDMEWPVEGRWLDDFVYPTSPPITLHASEDPALGEILLRRHHPLLNNPSLGYTVRISNVSRLFNFDCDAQRLSFAIQDTSDDMMTNIGVVGEADVALLRNLSEAILLNGAISFGYSSRVLVTMLADAASENHGVDDDRICLGSGNGRIDHSSHLFPMLRALRSEQIRDLDLTQGIDLLSGLVRLTRLLALSSQKQLPLDTDLHFTVNDGELVGTYDRYAFLYNPQEDIVKQWAIE